MSALREQVTYEQYNAPDLTWAKEGDKDSPYRQFMARHILPFIDEVSDESVLDVGCGTGWLLHLLGENGAGKLVGVEPSDYAQLAKRYYPEAEIHKVPFEDFTTNETFDIVTFIMSTEVMDDLEAVFTKCARLVQASGRVIICKGNYEYFCADKYDYILTREEDIPGEEAVVKTQRPHGYGTTIDIYRSTDRVLDEANKSGLVLARDVYPFAPDPTIIEEVPRYVAFADQPIMELIELRRNPDQA